MSKISKFFKKRNKAKLSGRGRLDNTSKQIEFRTKHGGYCPFGYDLNPIIMEKLLQEFSVLKDIVAQYCEIMKNELSEQQIHRHGVAKNIKLAAKEDLHIIDAKKKLYENTMQSLDDTVTINEKKGTGDDYE